MENKLLSYAKENKYGGHKLHKDIGPEQIQFALEWARGKISLSQASTAFKKRYDVKHGAGVYVLLARALRAYVQDEGI